MRRVAHQRTERHGLLRIDPVRSLVGALHGFVLEVAHAVVVTDHLRTGRENLGGNDQIFVIAAADDEHLFMLTARNVAQFNAGAFEGGKFRKECRFALVRGKHDEMALGRNFTEIDRKFGLAPLREAAGSPRRSLRPWLPCR